MSLKKTIHFYFQELANPLVGPHLNFYPHETYGKNVFASYQSFKWLGLLSREYRVQMVSVLGKHFYIYEPVQLRGANHSIVIPIFFYYHQDQIYAKCVHPQIVKLDENISSKVSNVITIPANIDFYSPLLDDIPVSDFELPYFEINLADGSKFIDTCGGYIVGVWP